MAAAGSLALLVIAAFGAMFVQSWWEQRSPGWARPEASKARARAELVPTSSARTSMCGTIRRNGSGLGLGPRRSPDSQETDMSLITVLSPVAELRTATTAIPPLPADLRGLTVGFLDNTKHNFDRLVAGIGEALKERHGVERVVIIRKANAATGAAHSIIEQLSKECDLVFSGSAD
jgi:hypothetical protein